MAEAEHPQAVFDQNLAAAKPFGASPAAEQVALGDGRYAWDGSVQRATPEGASEVRSRWATWLAPADAKLVRPL